jgi:heme exporter protein D
MVAFQFASFAEFIAMGGYAQYVWSAYAIFGVLVTANLIQPRLARRKLLNQLRARIEREENR